MSQPIRAACAQLTSGSDVAANLATCRRLCLEARALGASIVVLPENFAFVGTGEKDKFAVAEAVGGREDGPIVRALRQTASELGIWLIAGGMPERLASGTKVHNTLVALAPDGALAAVYRKVHLFDVHIPGGAVHQESATVEPGTEPGVLDTPLAPIGLSICYDLRFPELYRWLTRKGARVIVVPAAFTQHTGKDHWHTLLRARAIENQVYILAAGQFGRHNASRVTYGHSLIADPWGTVLAEAPDRECVIVADLDLAYQDKIRRELPVLDHVKL